MAIIDFFSRKEVPMAQPPKQEFFTQIETMLQRVNDMPKPKEEKGKDWVLFGPNNSFPLDLLDYKNSSALHNAIIESKTALIAGNGFIFETTRELSDAWLIENWTAIPFWRKLDKVFYQVARDQQTFGYSAFIVTYSMDRTRIADIDWIDASRLASGKKDEYGMIKSFWYSKNWSNINQNPPKEYAVFDPNGDEIKQIVFIKYEENNMEYFSLPSYYSALRWIKSDALMSEYNYSAISQGFSPSIVFKFYKKPTPEERRMNSEAIKAQHSGVKNAGKAVILYSDGKDLSPDIQTLDATNIDSRLLQVSDQIVQQIISAHRAHPQLLGIQTPGRLGFSSELLQSWEIFNNMVIKPERKLIMDHFKMVFIFNGVLRAGIEELVPIKIVSA